MDTAYSLTNRSNLKAEGVRYRENLDNQLVCPECFEPVFKKELWVDSKQNTTHFFSHYAGKFDSCSLRTSDEGFQLSDFQNVSQKQRLKIFNQEFRSRIKLGLKKTIKSKRFEDAIEYAERVSESESKIKVVDSLAKKMINLLGDPIYVSISPKLEQLEKAILPLYHHLQSKYGYKNLKFLSCVALINISCDQTHIFEDMLKLKRKSFDQEFLGAGVLLLANYIDWHSSLTVVEKFIANHKSDSVSITSKGLNFQKNIKTSKVSKSDSVNPKRKVMGYMECPKCHTYLYLPSSSWCLCSVCDEKFYSANTNNALSHNPSKNGALQNSLKPNGVINSMVGELLQRSDKLTQKNITPELPLNKDISIKYKKGLSMRSCSKCNRSYFEDKLSDCPHDGAKYSYPNLTK